MSRVVHFEIQAEDPQRASQFYQRVFDWNIKKWDGPAEYWLITTGPDSAPGINGALLPRQGPLNGNSVIAYVCTIDVASLDDALNAVLANGGSMVLDKMAVPGIGWMAYCKDTEGNIFGMMQNDPSASAPGV